MKTKNRDMQQANFISTLRALLVLAGSYLVGHNLFGKPLDSQTWEIIVGALVTVATTIWGIADKSTTLEGFESALRSVLTSIGGLFVASGQLSGDNLNAILGLIPAIATSLQSYLSKSKVQQIATGTVTPSDTGKVTKSIPPAK
jgi:hypothetical protein